MMFKKLLSVYIIFSSFLTFSQENKGTLTGNIETTFQYLNEDTLIGASLPPEKGLINTYMNVFYVNNGFKAGGRFESYAPRINGYPAVFSGTGLGMRYIGYTNALVDVTVGNFYEQFGSGALLRAYENRALGYDNALDGLRLIIKPKVGIVIKAAYGYQRESFTNGRIELAEGIVRGIDGEIHLNETFKFLIDKKLDITLGGSFVSKYQKDNDDNLILPENVGSYGGRFKIRYNKFFIDGEYSIKENDPSADNKFIYNNGYAALFNMGWSKKGLGFSFSGKSIDNMSYRSDRSKGLQMDLINYLPSLNKTHTYNLVASLYPYATQLNGEIAYQAEVVYTIPKGSKLGGKYGTTINANFSNAYDPLKSYKGINALDSTGIAYSTNLFSTSKTLLWQDFNINISKKFSKSFNIILNYFDIKLNNDFASITEDATGIITAHVGVVEIGYKINKNHSFRIELQELVTNKGPGRDKGDWATGVIEYNYKSNWFVGLMDQYNYANPHENLRIHYVIGTVGYVHESTRFTVSYGRQRAGLFCVGGVCRVVPASNGLTLSFTQSF